MSGRTSDLLVLVPAYNEAETIAAVVTAARAHLGCDVLVVNDGSLDATAAEASKAGAWVLSHPVNLGVGGAVRSGLRWAWTNGYQRAVQIDGDGQHEPGDVAALLERLDAGADLVVGSRFAAGYEVSAPRRLMMRLLSTLVSRSTPTRITDTTSGFRAFGPAALELLWRAYPTEYLSDTVEALLIAADAGLRIEEVPVRMHQRQGGVASSRSLRSVLNLARIFVVIVLHPIRAPLPQRPQT